MNRTIDNEKTNPALAEVDEVWIALLEQGLVPLLEHVLAHEPVTVFDKDLRAIRHTCFPEQTIRTRVESVMSQLVRKMEASTMLRQKLLVAMAHSGNSSLRLNIFSSMILLLGRSKDIGKYGICFRVSMMWLTCCLIQEYLEHRYHRRCCKASAEQDSTDRGTAASTGIEVSCFL